MLSDRDETEEADIELLEFFCAILKHSVRVTERVRGLEPAEAARPVVGPGESTLSFVAIISVSM